MAFLKPRFYELMCVVYQGLGESEVENLLRGLVSALKEMEVSVLHSKVLGIMDLVYEIKRHRKGYCCLLLVKVKDNAAFSSFVVKLRVNELIVRHSCVRLKSEAHFKPEITGVLPVPAAVGN